MDSLSDLLSKRLPDEPPEIGIVKDYVRQHFRETVQVAVRGQDVIITVRSSSLAGTLRGRTSAIRQALGGADKRLIFRIGRV